MNGEGKGEIFPLREPSKNYHDFLAIFNKIPLLDLFSEKLIYFPQPKILTMIGKAASSKSIQKTLLKLFEVFWIYQRILVNFQANLFSWKTNQYFFSRIRICIISIKI